MLILCLNHRFIVVVFGQGSGLLYIVSADSFNILLSTIIKSFLTISAFNFSCNCYIRRLRPLYWSVILSNVVSWLKEDFWEGIIFFNFVKKTYRCYYRFFPSKIVRAIGQLSWLIGRIWINDSKQAISLLSSQSDCICLRRRIFFLILHDPFGSEFIKFIWIAWINLFYEFYTFHCSIVKLFNRSF